MLVISCFACLIFIKGTSFLFVSLAGEGAFTRPGGRGGFVLQRWLVHLHPPFSLFREKERMRRARWKREKGVRARGAAPRLRKSSARGVVQRGWVPFERLLSSFRCRWLLHPERLRSILPTCSPWPVFNNGEFPKTGGHRGPPLQISHGSFGNLSHLIHGSSDRPTR